MLQDISPYVFDNSYRDIPPEKNSYIIVTDNRRVLADTASGEIVFPVFSGFPGQPAELIYLFSISGRSFFLSTDRSSADILLEKGYEYTDARRLQSMQPQHLAFAGVAAASLAEWYLNNRFCGRCGTETGRDQRERMLKCPVCGNHIYPRINPAVIVAVLHRDKILLTKYAGRMGIPFFALIAGFAEVGETLEDTVRREVMEEVGIKVKNIRYYNSQPWVLTDTLLSGFFCDLDGDCEDITLDTNELSTAVWMGRKDVPVRENLSLTATMMNLFRTGNEPAPDSSPY